MLHHLHGNGWYNRVWITQEYVRATSITFLCGEHTMSKDLVYYCTHRLYKLARILPRNLQEFFVDTLHSTMIINAGLLVDSLHQVDISSQTGLQKLASTMLEPSEQSHTHHHCLLPQDRVFGMMGILSPLQC